MLNFILFLTSFPSSSHFPVTPFLARAVMDVGYVVYLSVDGAQDDDAEVGLITYYSSASGCWTCRVLRLITR